MRRLWPTEPRKTIRPQNMHGVFLPPATTEQTPPPARDYLPLPCEFRPPADPASGPAVKILQRALQRHRLLFLWYAEPAHAYVPDHEAPDKGDLYDLLNVSACGSDPARPADDIFTFSDSINDWLIQQQEKLGTGPQGKPLETKPWPVGPYAYWTFRPNIVMPLLSS